MFDFKNQAYPFESFTHVITKNVTDFENPPHYKIEFELCQIRFLTQINLGSTNNLSNDIVDANQLKRDSK